MILHKLRLMRENQKGFTLIEVIVALAITSIIGVGATMATVQVVNEGSHSSDYTTASQHAMNAVYWISRDAQMAQTVAPDGGSSGFPLKFNWTEWDNSEHQVTYSIEDGKLRRNYSGSGSSQTLVADYINTTAENTTCEINGKILTLTVTATIGANANAVSVTKVREITPRPGL